MIVHYGTVEYREGKYVRVDSQGEWTVAPIAGFEHPNERFFPRGLRAPLGQIEIVFAEPIEGPYTVVVSAMHSDRQPSLVANYGRRTPNGFVVHLYEAASDRTLQNGDFSFIVLAHGQGRQ